MATERLAILLEAVGSSAVVRDLEKVSGATRGLGDKAKAAGGVMRGLKGNAEQLTSSFGGLSGMIAGLGAEFTALVGFASKAVSTYYDLGMAVIDFSRASGATMEQSSQLVAAFDDVGISADVGSKAIFQLGKRLSTEGAKLAEYGVFASRGADGNVDLAATLLDVADAYTRTADPAERAALVTTAFGKSGQQLLPILERGRSGIEAMFAGAAEAGQIFDEADRAKVLAYQEAMDNLSDSLTEISLVAGENLVPNLSKVANALSELIQFAQRNSMALQALFKPLLGGLAQLPGLSNFLLDKLPSGGDSTAKAMRTAGEASEDLAKKLADAEKEAKTFRDTAFGVVDAQRDLESASRALGGAERDLADKQAALDKLLRDGAVDEKEVARARRDLTEATKAQTRADADLTEAQQQLVTAQSVLNDLLTGSGAGKAEKIADAQDDLTAAGLRQRSATQRQWQAQDRLNEVMNDASATGEDLLAAQLDLDQANFDLKQATDAVTDATNALNEAERIGSEMSAETVKARQDVKDAQQGVADALDNVAEANQRVKDKQEALGTALAGDPNYKKEVADARQAVADATQAVADASQNVAAKANDAYQKQKDFNAAMEDGVNQARALKTELEALQREHPELAPLFAPVLASLQAAIVNAVAKNPRSNVPLNRVGPAVPALAGGGIVTEPMLAHIGEAGPEAVIPLSRGSSGFGSPIYVTVNAGIAGDADRVGNEIYAVLKRLAQRNGGLGLN